ncbi:glutamic-type intramembrane protease PrsW [Paenibacillus radicibacter]|uniref:glutamic-type intramembrane protease PrsW n=1 Tax=Paenibacillus radicibacter TaxID=2972488 RepID=UPI00280AF998|nr:glutamic-type intramembrane protease PrsW [Paenibacillus radicibacter]
MAAIAPGLSLLAYFYLKDRYETEPIRVVMKVFILGALLVIPSMMLQHVFMEEFGTGSELVFAFGYSGGIEEFLKWFLLYHVIYRNDQFDEPYDGIVYATAVSLGFATLENIMYALLNTFTFSALLIRALLPVSGHALFGVFMGYYIGKAKFNPDKQRRYMFMALALPAFWHGLFDYIMMMSKTYWLWFIIPLMIFLWMRTMWKVERANDRSPLRVLKRDEEVKTG